MTRTSESSTRRLAASTGWDIGGVLVIGGLLAIVAAAVARINKPWKIVPCC